MKTQYESDNQLAAQIMSCFSIDSRQTLYKELRYADIDIKPITSGRNVDHKPLAQFFVSSIIEPLWRGYDEFGPFF